MEEKRLEKKQAKKKYNQLVGISSQVTNQLRVKAEKFQPKVAKSTGTRVQSTVMKTGWNQSQRKKTEAERQVI